MSSSVPVTTEAGEKKKTIGKKKTSTTEGPKKMKSTLIDPDVKLIENENLLPYSDSNVDFEAGIIFNRYRNLKVEMSNELNFLIFKI
jgi:hypothetical protein